MSTLSYLQIRNPKDDETPIEATTQIFSALLPSHFPLWRRAFYKPRVYAFEIFLINQTIYFYVTSPQENEQLIHSLISSSYPKSLIKKTTDPLDIIMKNKYLNFGEMRLNSSYYLPIKTYTEFKIDPLSALIGYLAKQEARISMGVQILITPASFPWQKNTVSSANAPSGGEGAAAPAMPGKSLGLKKTGFQGGKALIRLIVGTNDTDIPQLPYLHNLAGTFGGFSLGEGNQFSFKKPILFRDKFLKRFRERSTTYFERKDQILNAQELATLWHPPGTLLKGVKNIAWGRTLAGEPPENLPVADNTTEEEKKEINFFAKAEFKNKDQIFGIKAADRRRHMYIMGKTGTGKSTLIGNMAIDDIRRDRGIGVIDPHGDLCEAILDYIPKRRLNDVIYLEPFDTERPFSLNVLEVHNNNQHRDLVASGIVAIFSKLYKDSWGPRLEYILRNVILTLLDLPDATLVDALNILSHEGFRKQCVARLNDPVIRDFWVKEFDKMPDRLKADAISPIQNKVGQFVQSRMIRNIIGQKKSTISLEEVMDSGKILLLNLSQGKLGEDNAALLGAMIITQIQLAAMNRSFQKEEDRRDFFLYVDEFQNFATSSFIKILSEARKYRLALILTNQYIEQLDEEIQRAIFGNVGTLISFVVGARDAEVLSKEFGSLYTPNELVSLGKFETVLKLSIDNMMSAPFPAKTLPPPSLKNENREKIVKLSKERYGRKIVGELPSVIGMNDELEIPPDKEQKPKRLSSPDRTYDNRGGEQKRYDREGERRSNEYQRRDAAPARQNRDENQPPHREQQERPMVQPQQNIQRQNNQVQEPRPEARPQPERKENTQHYEPVKNEQEKTQQQKPIEQRRNQNSQPPRQQTTNMNQRNNQPHRNQQQMPQKNQEKQKTPNNTPLKTDQKDILNRLKNESKMTPPPPPVQPAAPKPQGFSGTIQIGKK